MTGSKRLYRSRTRRVFGGVCGGIAEYTNTDPTVVRLTFAIAALLWGGGALAYGALYLLIPEAPARSQAEEGRRG